MVKIMENLIKMDDLGVHLFLETPKCMIVFEGFSRRIVDSLGWCRIVIPAIGPLHGPNFLWIPTRLGP